MQNQYVGDIGDFGKYGLLREIFGRPEVPGSGCGLRLGVAWYLFPDEPPKDPNKPDNRDGSLTDYLYDKRDNHEKYRKCDTELYDELRRIVIQEKKRDVTRIRESGILLWDTVYYENSLSYPRKQPMPLRKSIRESWLEGTLAATAKADVVFVDPDNGIASENISAWRKNGPKYVFMDDLNRFYCNGKSLVIYQHLTRQCKAPEQINKLAERLQESLKSAMPAVGAVVSPWHGAGLLHRRSRTAQGCA